MAQPVPRRRSGHGFLHLFLCPSSRTRGHGPMPGVTNYFGISKTRSRSSAFVPIYNSVSPWSRRPGTTRAHSYALQLGTERAQIVTCLSPPPASSISPNIRPGQVSRTRRAEIPHGPVGGSTRFSRQNDCGRRYRIERNPGGARAAKVAKKVYLFQRQPGWIFQG